MAKRLNIIVQLASRQSVTEFRAGIGDSIGIIALGPETEASWRMCGIDAFYLSVTRAERWGARPIPPHTVRVLRTRAEEQESGLPPYIVTGVLLREGDPDNADFCIPRIVNAVVDAIAEVNRDQPGAIRTLGFFEFELSFRNGNLTDVARRLVESFEMATSRRKQSP